MFKLNVQRWLNLEISLQTLARTALYGSMGVAISYYFTYFLIQSRIRRTVTYKKALEIFHNEEKAVKYLGEPVKEGRIELFYDDDNTRKFRVKLKGSNTKGILDCEYDVDSEYKTIIKKLAIKFPDIPDKTFVILEA
ncbi:unnamed protein product [Xylocopa violacea]|uniref:Uncharacterized protein n=1 Tax=Xylocopa violacea TaxID=135666 RepID=A0ABP1NUS7_XYLVO